MFSIIALASSFLLCGIYADGDVHVLTDANFASEIAKHDVALVKFYAPWCGHCKKMAPEFEAAAKVLKKQDPPVSLIKVDCTVETSTCSQYGVSGYPTLKIFKGGEMSKAYDGPREKDGIVRKMIKESGPVSKLLEKVEQLKKFLSMDSVGVIGFFKSEDSSLAKTYLKVADALPDLRFAHTVDDAVKSEMKQDDEAIVLYRPKVLQSKFEEAEVKCTKTGKDNIKSFLQSEALGLCGVRNQGNAADFQKPLFVAYFNVDYEKNPKGSNYWRNRVMKVGKKLKEGGASLNFAISDLGEMGREVDECGISDKSGDKPVVCGWDDKGMKFKMEDEFSMDSFEQFVNDVQAGKLDPWMKSEPIPEDNDEPGKVKVVVGKNFDEIVNDKDKDVFIEFYAPWCGHCKAMAPAWDDLAKKLIDDDSVVIAKMDATANDKPALYDVRGFPTIYFKKMGQEGKPMKYEGGRDVPQWMDYLKKKSTNKLADVKEKKKDKKKKKGKKDEL